MLLGKQGGELEEAEAGKAAKVAKAEWTPSPERVDVGLAKALLAMGAEVAETATAVGTKRGELLGAATPEPWLDWGWVEVMGWTHGQHCYRIDGQSRVFRIENVGYRGARPSPGGGDNRPYVRLSS